jgi:DUF438 domain-containing protein
MSPASAGSIDKELMYQIFDGIPVGITIVDLEGRILYYNAYSTRILQSKPEYIGRDIRLCHQKAESIAAVDRMLAAFKEGRDQSFGYETVRYGNRLSVSFLPLYAEGRVAACLQSVLLQKPDDKAQPASTE